MSSLLPAQMSVSIIIPALNEEETVGDVVRAARAARVGSEVIVVDDGSNDRTAERAKEAGATVVRLHSNRGKAAAMREGVHVAGSALLCFLDADLIGLSPNHVRTLTDPLLSGRADQVIGLPTTEEGTAGRPALGFFLSGQRSIRRELFEQLRETEGFGVEMAMNQLCGPDRCLVVRLPGLDYRRKYHQRAPVEAAAHYLRIWRDVAAQTLRGRGGRFLRKGVANPGPSAPGNSGSHVDGHAPQKTPVY